MSSDIVRRFTTGAPERAHARNLDAHDRQVELAEEKVAGIGQVTGRATFEIMKIGLLRREAKRIAPEDSELFDLIAVAGSVGMAEVIGRLGQGR